MKATDGHRHARDGQGLVALLLAQFINLYAAAPAQALQILEAADHAELTAEVSADEVNRIALDGDRVARVIQSPGDFTVEHDAVRGDLYLYTERSGSLGTTSDRAESDIAGAPALPVTLYLGTERGFTYRLNLSVVNRDSAQILIRNAAVIRLASDDAGRATDGYASELVALIRAVARREPVAGYVISSAANVADPPSAGSLVEVWRGPRFTARVLRVSGADALDASTLAQRAGRPVSAAWLSPPGHDRNGERLAVLVESHAAPETAR